MPDGSYGNIASGIYDFASGKMNLVTGNFTVYSSGQNGDLYGAGEAPNTSTLPVPTPWTSTGAGVAIPASEVGETTNHTASNIMTSPTITLPLSNVPPSTSKPAPTSTRTARAINGRAAKSTLGGLPRELVLAVLMVWLL